MKEKSVLQVAFERNPFWTVVALAMPFGIALGMVAAIVKLPPVKRRRCNLCGKRRRADGEPCPRCQFRDGQCGIENPKWGE
jgi:hypothetical protein